MINVLKQSKEPAGSVCNRIKFLINNARCVGQGIKCHTAECDQKVATINGSEEFLRFAWFCNLYFTGIKYDTIITPHSVRSRYQIIPELMQYHPRAPQLGLELSHFAIHFQ